MTDREICNLVKAGTIKAHELEKKVKNPVRGVGIRRILFGEMKNFKEALRMLPYHNFDYTKVEYYEYIIEINEQIMYKRMNDK